MREVTPTERHVIEVWSSLLDVNGIGPDDDFFEVGGHSMVAVQVLAELEERTGVNLDLESFFDLATVGAIAAELERRRADQPVAETFVGEL